MESQPSDGRGGTCSLRLGISSLRVYSPSGVLMYHEAVITPVEEVVDWVYVMERVLHKYQRNESVQVFSQLMTLSTPVSRSGAALVAYFGATKHGGMIT